MKDGVLGVMRMVLVNKSDVTVLMVMVLMLNGITGLILSCMHEGTHNKRLVWNRYALHTAGR
jgi:hypothetical protein